MKLVIFAGGFGSRLGKLTEDVPKPMLFIGDRPILWHIMKIYSSYGINDFVICLGYKSQVIKQYFLDYEYQHNDFTLSLKDKTVTMNMERNSEDWKITFVETGLNALKGARLKKVEQYLDEGINLLTYGDGVSDINISELIAFHKKLGKTLTLSAVHPPARFGEISAVGDVVTSFEEKSQTSQGFINGGFMVFEKKLLDLLIEDDDCDLEFGVFEHLAARGEIAAYKHEGLWACMDTGRDMEYLNDLWNNNRAFWKTWS